MGNYAGQIKESNKNLLTYEYTNKNASKIQIKTTEKARYRGFF